MQEPFDVYVVSIIENGVVTSILPSYIYSPEPKEKNQKETS